MTYDDWKSQGPWEDDEDEFREEEDQSDWYLDIVEDEGEFSEELSPSEYICSRDAIDASFEAAFESIDDVEVIRFGGYQDFEPQPLTHTPLRVVVDRPRRDVRVRIPVARPSQPSTGVAVAR